MGEKLCPKRPTAHCRFRLRLDSPGCCFLVSAYTSLGPTLNCIPLCSGKRSCAASVTLIGASLSEPHINGTSAARVCYMYVYMSIVRHAIIQCRLLFCVHNSTFQHAMCARAARDHRWWLELTMDSVSMSKVRAGGELIVVL